METRSLDFITTTEAAERLGCTVQHIRLLVRQGRLSAERVGRDWMIDQQAVLAIEKARYARSPSPRKVVREPQVASLFSDAELQTVVNVASVPQRSPFRYPGGKTWLIPIARAWLASCRPNLTRLAEPFAGGGGIGLMATMEDYVDESVLVELDPEVASVWHAMLTGDGPALAERIRSFLLTPATVTQLFAESPPTTVERAFQTIVRNRVSRGGILAPGAGRVKNGEAGKGIASRWYPDTLAKRILTIHQFRHRIGFVEGDGVSFLDQVWQDPKTALFVDPPYPVAGKRLYRFHDLNHRVLFEKMRRHEGPILATYDHNLDIIRLASEHGFATRLVPMKSTHHERKFELLVSKDFSWLPEGINAFAS